MKVHDFYTDAELFDYLSGLHASLLPYRFGTHSGWMEAAHDLGTTVIAPDVGCYHSQGADFLYRWQSGGLDAPSLHRAVHAAAESSTADSETAKPWLAPAARLHWRREQRRAIAAAHAEVYARALSGR